jgi:hypothetical protein
MVAARSRRQIRAAFQSHPRCRSWGAWRRPTGGSAPHSSVSGGQAAESRFHRRTMMSLFFGGFIMNICVANIPGRTLWNLVFG